MRVGNRRPLCLGLGAQPGGLVAAALVDRHCQPSLAVTGLIQGLTGLVAPSPG
jgi:hypothetical protein